MKKLCTVFCLVLLFCNVPLKSADCLRQSDQLGPVTVACYYFPNYHPNDSRNQELKGDGWSEWNLVKEAKPRFKSHKQPNVPLWGYTDESDPSVMAQKIDAAASHGIDAFIFDWYWFDDGRFLERALDEGFLKAENNDLIKFSLMWANHDWIDIHPYKKDSLRRVLYKGVVKKQTFDQMCDHVINKYFKHPSYWKIQGKPYFSIYELNKLMQSFGSIEATRAALDLFRFKAKKEGFSDIHLNAVVWGRSIIPGEQKPANPADIVKRLGFDSVTSYVWIHHVELPNLQTDYTYVQEEYFKYWTKAQSLYDVPYHPNVTMGWDSSPRTDQNDTFGNFGYPFMNTIAGNTPERFQQALQATKQRMKQSAVPHILTINCWNEWTEGSYLEPDTRNMMAYLEAVKNVFGDSLIKPNAVNTVIPVSIKAVTKNLPINGEVFTIDGQIAFLILPKKTKSERSIPWVWYAPTLPGLPGTGEKWMFDTFLEKGIAIAGVDVGESYGSPKGRAIYSALYKELVVKRGLAKKTCLLARSRGGLMLYNWAAENAGSVACIAGIYPVCNLTSYPGLERACDAYGMTSEQLAIKLAEHNPIDRLAPLAEVKVPILHIHGNIDELVPLEENSGEMAKRYTKLGGNMTLNIVKGQGHNMWPGWFQNQDLVNFVITHAGEETPIKLETGEGK